MKRTQQLRLFWCTIGAIVFCVESANAGLTTSADVNKDGVLGNKGSGWNSISADGRFVAFMSESTDLVANDTNGRTDVFVRDMQAGTITRVNVASNGDQALGGNSSGPCISADGRYVAFESVATNLVANDTNQTTDVFVYDRKTKITTRENVVGKDIEVKEGAFRVSLSANGRYIAYLSSATNLVDNDTNGVFDVFVRDRQTGKTTRVNVASNGEQANDAPRGQSDPPFISADGRYVAFLSTATNLVANDTNQVADIFVHDLRNGITTRESVATDGSQSNAFCLEPSMSANGRYVAFVSSANNLVIGDTNNSRDIFVRDRRNGITTRVSVNSNGAQVKFGDSQGPSLSANGRYITFNSPADSLVSNDTNQLADIFVRDLQSGITTRVSLASDGSQSISHCIRPKISANGRYIAFESMGRNLVPDSKDGHYGVFVHDRKGDRPVTLAGINTRTFAEGNAGSSGITATTWRR